MLTDCPWLAWTRLAYRPSYRDGRNASTFWGLGLNIAPNGGEAAIAFFTFQIHPWHQATTTKLGTAISSTPSDVMLRQRERANHDGSTSPVGRYVQAISAGILPSRGHVDNASTESKLRALAVIMDTLNEAAISLLRQALFDDPRSGNAKTSEFREFDAMADSSRPPKDISCSEEDMTNILGRLRDTKCFAFWTQAWGKCLRDGHWRYPLQAQAALDLWKAAARLYQEIMETDDSSTEFDMAVSTGVLVKIRSLEPLAMSWAEKSEFNPPDVDCVSKNLRSFADQMNRDHRNMRMHALHQRFPNSLTLVSLIPEICF